jgi:hypothetical protein
LDGGGLVDDMFNPITQIATSSGDPVLGGGTAKGGNILIKADTVELVNSAQNLIVYVMAPANAGIISIEASTVRLDALLMTPTQITANSWQQSGGGNAGNIAITCRSAGNAQRRDSARSLVRLWTRPAGSTLMRTRLTFATAAIITAGTFGSAPGGNVRITADSLNIDGRDPLSGVDFPTGIQAVTATYTTPAPGGNLQIDVDEITMDHGARFLPPASSRAREATST